MSEREWRWKWSKASKNNSWNGCGFQTSDFFSLSLTWCCYFQLIIHRLPSLQVELHSLLNVMIEQIERFLIELHENCYCLFTFENVILSVFSFSLTTPSSSSSEFCWTSITFVRCCNYSQLNRLLITLSTSLPPRRTYRLHFHVIDKLPSLSLSLSLPRDRVRVINEAAINEDMSDVISSGTHEQDKIV